MLFAPNSKHASLQLQSLDGKETLQTHDAKAMTSSHQQHSNLEAGKSTRINNTSRSAEIVAAMKKLDAKLVAYLAGEEIPAKEKQLSLQRLQNTSPIDQVTNEGVEQRFREQQLQVFKRITAIHLQMEALTLQPEGTKRMELLQSDIRPIFTVECQLSNELIKHVPRYELFNIMQFESEKFHSLTQCTRFGQEAKRDVRLVVDDDSGKEGNTTKHPNFGRLHFIVWWREPSTCLNETLGIGVLELAELYNASLLEQCKCITINRRGIHLGSLYFKISLQLQRQTAGQLQKILGQTTIKQSAGSVDEKQQGKPQQGEQKEQPQQSQEAKTTAGNDGNNADSSQQNKNNNFQLGSSNFTAETTKVRLLKGFIYANKIRKLTTATNCDYFLVCRRFWQNETATTRILGSGEGNLIFNYQEQFAVLNDEKFLKRVEKQHLELELLQRPRADGNGNADVDVQPLTVIGTARLPLHQFFIAYRDAAITNHICKGKFPVISIDAFVPIINQRVVGELECLLAIGSEEQIENLKESRSFLQTASTAAVVMPTTRITPHEMSRTGDLLDILQQTLVTEHPTEVQQTSTAKMSSSKPMQESNVNSFKLSLEIVRATDLPLNPPTVGKFGSKRQASALASKRFPPNKAPNSYVTFQAEESLGQMYKSHEGMVYGTKIIDQCTHPLWQQRFCMSVSVDYLTNPQKRFILKIWKKSATDLAQRQPTPMEDAIIGFAALDFNVFLRGLQIDGLYNIIDFNGRINGKLEVRCHPLENVKRILHSPKQIAVPASVDVAIEQFADSLELTHLNLGQAIKRKFTELEQISQHLRTRLVDVTGEQFAPHFDSTLLDSWQPLDDDTDADMDEFESDINASPIAQEDENPKEMISEAPSGDLKE